MSEMDLKLLRCSNERRSWYALSKTIGGELIPISCETYPYIEAEPDKIEFVKEVSVNLGELIKGELEKQEPEFKLRYDHISAQDQPTRLFWRVYWK
jgi:hypothetical protein